MTYKIIFKGKRYGYDVLDNTPKTVTVRIIGDNVNGRVTVTIKRRDRSSKELEDSCPTSITMTTKISTVTPVTVQLLVDVFNTIAIAEEWSFRAETPVIANFEVTTETCD